MTSSQIVECKSQRPRSYICHNTISVIANIVDACRSRHCASSSNWLVCLVK